MRGFTSVTVAGNLVADPEIVTTGAQPRTSVSVAVNYVRGSGEQKKEGVYYFDVAVFGGAAESLVKWKKKGDPILVSGSLVQQRWETQDGQKRSRVGIVAREVHFLSRSASAGAPPDIAAAMQAAFPGASEVSEGDIPF